MEKVECSPGWTDWALDRSQVWLHVSEFLICLPHSAIGRILNSCCIEETKDLVHSLNQLLLKAMVWKYFGDCFEQWRLNSERDYTQGILSFSFSSFSLPCTGRMFYFIFILCVVLAALPASLCMYHVLVLRHQSRVSNRSESFHGYWEFKSFPDSLKAAMPPSHCTVTCLAHVKVRRLTVYVCS